MTTEDPGTPGATPLPAIEIVGDASPEQVAALLSVLSAAGSEPAADPPARRSPWSAPAARLRRPLPHGPGVWRLSLRA